MFFIPVRILGRKMADYVYYRLSSQITLVFSTAYNSNRVFDAKTALSVLPPSLPVTLFEHAFKTLALLIPCSS
jgi:hypothetical protein